MIIFCAAWWAGGAIGGTALPTNSSWQFCSCNDWIIC